MLPEKVKIKTKKNMDLTPCTPLILIQPGVWEVHQLPGFVQF